MQFNYCPLVWMFCWRTSNNMINKLHERLLIIVLNEYSSDYNELLEHNKDITSHHKNIQTLLIEVFKIELAPPIMEPMLNRSVNTYNLRSFQGLVSDRNRINWYGLERLSYLYPQRWWFLPKPLRETNYLS